MVIPQLPPEWVDEGEQLIRALDNAGIPIAAAFWLFEEDVGWRLVLASSEVDQFGKRHFYSRVIPPLHSLPGPRVSSSYVTAMRTDDPIVAAVHRMVSTPGLTRVRLTGNVSNGVLIPDALVYRA